MVAEQNDLTDAEVVTAVLGGDKDSFSQIVERYEAKLLRYIVYLIKDPDQAADILQDTFIKAYINLRSFRLNKQFSSWIYRIAHNETINAIKKSGKTSTFSDLNISGDDFAVDFSFGKAMDKMFLKKEVQRCLKTLNVKYSEVILLYFFENLSYQEISDILRIPTSTVGVRIGRAKKILKAACMGAGVKL
jgi:RNA polymerase sigma-70 factor (ECF subfamily)